jgi:hypothetical protein
VHEGTLGKWVADYRREHADEEPPLTLSLDPPPEFGRSFRHI